MPARDDPTRTYDELDKLEDNLLGDAITVAVAAREFPRNGRDHRHASNGAMVVAVRFDLGLRVFSQQISDHLHIEPGTPRAQLREDAN